MKTLTIMEKALFKIVEGASSKGKTPKYKRALKLKWRRYYYSRGALALETIKWRWALLFGGRIPFLEGATIMEERWLHMEGR